MLLTINQHRKACHLAFIVRNFIFKVLKVFVPIFVNIFAHK
jgi:hypothetical protein